MPLVSATGPMYLIVPLSLDNENLCPTLTFEGTSIVRLKRRSRETILSLHQGCTQTKHRPNRMSYPGRQGHHYQSQQAGAGGQPPMQMPGVPSVSGGNNRKRMESILDVR